jgi:hypothetical protein
VSKYTPETHTTFLHKERDTELPELSFYSFENEHQHTKLEALSMLDTFDDE